jgi:cobalt-zinc-cadmium efflux system outer membrane protein
MNRRCGVRILAVAMLQGVSAVAQAPAAKAPLASGFTDEANGLSLEQAIARALEYEPSLRAARGGIDVARGMRMQAGLRPNPSVSFERRDEPAGTDSQTMVAVEWPLDLFRKPGRTAVTEREVVAAELSVSDRERLLASDVRMRYGDALAAIRDLAILDELVAVTGRQHDLLGSRVQEGQSAPLERDLLAVELGRLESDRLLQLGRTESALIELKRLLGLDPAATLTVRDTLEGIVMHESSSAPALADAPAVQQRADVREAETRIGIAEARLDRAEREGRFDASVFASYTRVDAGFPQLGLTPDGRTERVRGLFHYVAAGARVTVPLLNRSAGTVAAARAERAGAAAAYEAARLTARTEIAAARARAERAQQAVRLYGADAQALARQNFTVVGQSYQLGRITVFDVLTEQRRYLDVERAYTDALRVAYEARTALGRALGVVR